MAIDTTPESDKPLDDAPPSGGRQQQDQRFPQQQQSDSSDRPAEQQQQGQRQRESEGSPIPDGNGRVDSAPDSEDPDLEAELRHESAV